MDQLMTKEESYAERRKLFKTIWDTAMQIDEKDADIMKPKVIKTLRLDEVDRCVIGKKKKQRLTILRTVCNKILEFCDREDADDLFYKRMAVKGKQPLQHKLELQQKKTKMVRSRRKIKKAKSLLSPPNNSVGTKSTTSVRKEEFLKNEINKIKRTTLVKRSRVVKNTPGEAETNPKKITVPLTINFPGDTTVARHKVNKRIIIKRKKHQINNTIAPGI